MSLISVLCKAFERLLQDRLAKPLAAWVSSPNNPVSPTFVYWSSGWQQPRMIRKEMTWLTTTPWTAVSLAVKWRGARPQHRSLGSDACWPTVHSESIITEVLLHQPPHPPAYAKAQWPICIRYMYLIVLGTLRHSSLRMILSRSHPETICSIFRYLCKQDLNPSKCPLVWPRLIYRPSFLSEVYRCSWEQ